MNVHAEKKPQIAKFFIIFIDEDEVGVSYSYDNALLVTLNVGPSKVSEIMIDIGSSKDSIFKYTLNLMNIKYLRLGLVNITLYRFGESYILSIGIVQLPLSIESLPYQKTTMVTFLKDAILYDLGKVISKVDESN